MTTLERMARAWREADAARMAGMPEKHPDESLDSYRARLSAWEPAALAEQAPDKETTDGQV